MMRRMLWIVMAVLAMGCVTATVAQAQNAGETDKDKGKPPVVTPVAGDDHHKASTEEYIDLSGDEEGAEQKPNTEGAAAGNDSSAEHKPDNPNAETNSGNTTPPAPKVLMSDEEFERRVAALQEHWKRIEARVAAVKSQLERLPAEQLVKFEQLADETDAEVATYVDEKIPQLIAENDAVPAAAKAGKLAELAEWLERARQELLKLIGK